MYQTQYYNQPLINYGKIIPYQINQKNQLYQNMNTKNIYNTSVQINKNLQSNKLSSPETKLNFDCNQNIFYSKMNNLKLNNQMSFEDLKTQDSSSESLLSSNSKLSFNNFNNYNLNNKILTSPFNLCYNDFNYHQRNLSMNNLNNNINLFSFNNNSIENLTRGNLFSCNEDENYENEINNNLIEDNIIPLKKSGKNFYNKFNSPTENINNATSENTTILTLKIKISKNDYRIFNLKKYDDLFISLQKFFDLNKINQELVKPIVAKVFATLNKIFWLLNSKVGIYDQEYLNSLYRLWKKNKEKIPLNNHLNDNNDLNNNSLDKSSDSNSSKNKKGFSNSFQDENSIENSREDTSRSF